MEKVCSACQTLKQTSEFHKSSHRKDGFGVYCKECKKLDYLKNREKVLEQKKDYHKRNKDSILEKKHQYHISHRDARSLYNRKYRDGNRDKINKRKRVYERHRNCVDTLYKLTRQLRGLLSKSFAGSGFTKKSKTAVLLGCSFEGFMKHLGHKPCDRPHLDHICPVAQAKTEEEVIKLQNYINFQWLTPEENTKKGNKPTEEGIFLCRFLLGREWIYD
jgi:hypothetical protein